MSSIGSNYYTDKLDDIYKTASEDVEQYGEEIDAARAAVIIQELGIEFGDYTATLTEALEGMTEIEAFIYLNQVLSELDLADGDFDGVIDTSENTFEELMLKSVFSGSQVGGDEIQPDAAAVAASKSAIQTKLMESAEAFKQDNNPTDLEYIEQIEGSVKTNAPDTGNSNTVIQQGDTTITITTEQGNVADLNGDALVSTAESMAFYGLDSNDMSPDGNTGELALDTVFGTFSTFLDTLYGEDKPTSGAGQREAEREKNAETVTGSSNSQSSSGEDSNENDDE
jgi:hypothetical protein